MDIGIDLGTTFSVVAVDGKRDLQPDYAGGPGIYLDDCDVTVIPSPRGETTFPSVMMPDPENPSEWLFGSDALVKAEDGFAPIMFSKRKIGTSEAIPVSTGTVMAKEVAARFLRYLKHCAEQALGQRVSRAVVTHPAYFDRVAVEETREAARQAGFDMTLAQQLLMEPTAAALAYTRTDRRDPLRLLTYDLGGGTFDVTYMERIDDVIQVRAFDGNHLLGGYNFDKELVRLVRGRLSEKGRNFVLDEDDAVDRGRLARLLRIAENVKIDLSRTKAETDAVEFRVRNVLVDDKGAPIQVNERITRQQFVSAIQSWLDDVIACCQRALTKGNARPEDLHQVLLVGGSSHGPWVSDSLRSAFPNAQIRLFHPDLCVGAGAAVHARRALPQIQELGDYRLEHDTQETSVLEHIHVGGRIVHAATGRPAEAGMPVALALQSGLAQEPTSIGVDGRFLFKNVPLVNEGVNSLALHVRNAAGEVVLSHEFAVAYQPPLSAGSAERSHNTGVTGSTTVLPRPLYIETARGMVALAQEGAPLPAKVMATFERTNSNPNITLRLFQEQDPVGAVRIENIPAEAGTGSPVELTLEVTADNQVRGDVVIYRLVGRPGQPVSRAEALRSPIHVVFDPTSIPAAEALRQEFEELETRVEMLPLLDPFLAREVSGECAVLIERMRRALEHQPFERQEVFVDARRLRNLLAPPKDDMTPTRREFVMKVGQCRQTIAELRTRHESILAELNKSGADDLTIDGVRVSARRAAETVKRLDAALRKIDDIEKAGLAAHASKDRNAWPRTAERLDGIEADIDSLKPREATPDLSEMPTPLLKILVIAQELDRRARVVQRHAQALGATDEFSDWLGELTAILKQLDTSREAVLRIDDETAPKQALAQIFKILEQVRGLDARIAAIGKVLA